MSDGLAKLALTYDLPQVEAAAAAVFLQRALADGLRHVRSDSWPTGETSLAGLGEPALHIAAGSHETVLLERGETLLQVTRFGGHVQTVAAAATPDALDEAFSFLHERLPAPDPSSAQEVQVTFWTYTPHGPQPSWRTIGVPRWEEIRANYAAGTQAGLEALMAGFRPAHGGQLLLWHGEPGTGKTFALRALAWEWREWCELHYIVDPDSFFGQHADYLMSVLLQEGAPVVGLSQAFLAGGGWSGYAPGEDDEVDEEKAQRAWRVLVLEDTGELLSADARARIGQGLSRFLNVVDGLIGQGLRVLVLVTTNEEIRALHPAVGRPGRAAANVRFLPLAAEEAARWLADHGVEAAPSAPATLAALYARAEGRDAESVPFADSRLRGPGFTQ